MIKRICIILCVCCVYAGAVFAAPAYPRPHDVKQSDGTTITLLHHGNEYGHYLTNTKGQRVVLGEDGMYHIADTTLSVPQETALQRHRMRPQDEVQDVKKTFAKHSVAAAKSYRGLVLLVEFNDCSFRFSAEETQQLYNDMLNSRNYTGYNDAVYGGWQDCTGSVRDYFIDNSHGKFDPVFDVVGPVRMDVSCRYIQCVDNTYDLTEMILDKVNGEVDFSQYDSDGDGDVDMIYILYAGYSSMYQGNDELLVWPHATTLVDETGQVPDIIYDGVRMARFACSAEIYGWQADNDRMIDGIGTIVHEFSHVLGYQDHYDTSAGYQEHPNSWDVMDGGNYSLDYNRTPCAYNSFEKAVAGFIEPLDISDIDGDTITLRSTEISTDALVLHSQQEHVHSYMENRQRNKWDKYLVGHGMLVWRVDSVRPEYWTQNMINVTTRACFRLVRAQGTQGSFFTGVVDTDEDPFPGTKNVTVLNNEPLKADLLSYDQYPAPVFLQDICEVDSVIRMVVMRDTLADGRPIDYDVANRFYAVAEQWTGTEWRSVEWEVTHCTQTINGQETEVIYNFLPNTQAITQASSEVEGQFYVPYSQQSFNEYTVPARRLCLQEEYGVWIANHIDVEAGGSGAIAFTTNRHGIPVLQDENTELALLALKPTAYVASTANVLSVLERYRAIRFFEKTDEPEGIEQTKTAAPFATEKRLFNGQIIILRNGVAYTITGQPVHY